MNEKPWFVKVGRMGWTELRAVDFDLTEKDSGYCMATDANADCSALDEEGELVFDFQEAKAQVKNQFGGCRWEISNGELYFAKGDRKPIKRPIDLPEIAEQIKSPVIDRTRQVFNAFCNAVPGYGLTTV